jgi:hypothetical protein
MTVARWTLAGLCTLPLLLAGCDRGGTEAPDRPIEGGVVPDLVTPFVVQSEVTIGGDTATGPMALGGIQVARLIGSSILVPEVMNQEIRVFDLSGRYEETFGRRGEGPGEYEGLSAVF